MKALVSNCSHNSDIFLCEDIDRYGCTTAIIKSSSTIRGIESIRRELSGFNWYRERCKNDIHITVVREDPTYLKIKSTYIKGIKYPYQYGYSKNKNLIFSILDHYCEVWSDRPADNGLYALHGDLSMDNVIFIKNNIPVIIDWEHFSPRAAPLGFDGLNLLFEQLWFEDTVSRDNKLIIEDLANMLLFLKQKESIDHLFLEHPLEKTISFVKENFHLWNEQEIKLPILNFTSNEITFIDHVINKVLVTSS